MLNNCCLIITSIKFKKKVEIEGGGVKFILRMKFMTETEIEQWRSEFELKSKSSWIVSHTNPYPTYYQYVKDFVCHHNEKNKTKVRKNDVRNKNTLCQSKMYIKVSSYNKLRPTSFCA